MDDNSATIITRYKSFNLMHDLAGKAANLKQIPLEKSTALKKENALFILNSSAKILCATDRCNPSHKNHSEEIYSPCKNPLFVVNFIL